jgi:hypothetical protein
MTARERAAVRLEEHQSRLARAITDALYEQMPFLLEKYGERGRARCLEDMNFNLEHLRPAVELARPDVFVSYVRWLDQLLRARKVDTREVVRSLMLTERVILAEFPGDEAAAVLPSLHAALRELQAVGST